MFKFGFTTLKQYKSLKTNFKTTKLKPKIDEEKKKIRRAKPLPENLTEFETNIKQNTVYVASGLLYARIFFNRTKFKLLMFFVSSTERFSRHAVP